MIPIDAKTGKPWAIEHSHVAFRSIRSAVIDEFRKRDEQYGITAENGWKVYTEASDGTLTPDLVLASKKHTGADVDAVLIKRWRDYCSEPRDESAELLRLGANKPSEFTSQMIERAKSLEAGLRSGGSPSAATRPLPSSRPGSPATSTPRT